MTMRLKRSLATFLALVMHVQPLAQYTFAVERTVAARSGNDGTVTGAIPEPGTVEPGTKPLEPVEPLEPLEPATEQSGSGSVVYGPNTYVRTTGAPNIYNVSFSLPAGISGPFTMHVVNGNADGTNRLSSTTITLNGVDVALPGDFGQSVAGFDKTVNLQATNQVTYRVTSIPQGFMTVTFLGSTGGAVDTTAPQITITAPAPGSFTDAASIVVTLLANDPAGASGEPVSGINQASLQLLVDGTSYAGAVTWAGGQASASLAGIDEGEHTITAGIADNAGNPAAAPPVTFTIDRTDPDPIVVNPAAGQYTNAQTIEVSGGIVETNAPTVVVDGIPATITNGAFVAAAVPVGNGPDQTISVVATDAAGNTVTETVTIHVDRVAPVIAITSPAATVVHPGLRIDVTGTVTDASTVYVTVNDELMAVTNGTFAGQVELVGDNRVLRAVARDLAGNESIAERTVVVDSDAPVIEILEPAPDAITNAASIRVRATVTDSSSVVVKIGGLEVAPVAGIFEVMLPLHSEGSNALIVEATDAAGHESMVTVNVIADRVAPVVSFTSPAADAVVSSLPVEIQGTVNQDLTGATVKVNDTEVPLSGLAWSYALDGLSEGRTTITVEATDGAGNSSTATRSLLIDLNAPVVEIATPESGALTASESIVVTGTVLDLSVSAVTVNGITATLDPPGAGPRGFTATVPLAENDNAIIASATDAGGRTGSDQVMVTRDSTAPTIALTTDPKASLLRPAAVNIVAADSVLLDRVTVSVNGSLAQTFTAPPYVLNIVVPAGSRGGDTLSIVAEAIDRIGNRAQATASISVVSDGAVVGQVLTDVDGKPLEGATIAVDGGATLTSDARGRYTLAAPGTQVSLSVAAAGKTTVDRTFAIGREAGTSAIDARLTELATPSAVGAASSTLTAGSLAVLVPAGAFPDGSSLRVTPLSGQGLPGLLPLGWSPVAALDLRGPNPATALTLRAPSAGTQPLYLARYVNRAWHLASNVLTPDAGVVSVDLPIADAISVALVIPDSGDGAPAVPAIGEPLPGVDAVEIPFTAASTGVLDPPVLSPGGGTSIGTLTVTSPTPLPSGTVVQAVMTETFTLATGDTVSTDARTQDFVLYRAPTGLVAGFPVVPSRKFDAANLVQGIVHLDILAGRESVRGFAGGNASVTLSANGATLSVAQGALTSGDVPIAFQSAVLSSFLPATADVSPLREFSVDFSGRTLEIGADLSVLASQLTGVGVDDAVVIARIDSVEGVSRLVPVAVGELAGDRYHARALHGLPGITQGGRHVWYRVAGGVGFVRGVVDASGLFPPALIEVTGLPFVSKSRDAGQYTAVARVGDATLRAHAEGTSLVGEGPASITLNSESPLNIALVGAVSAATVSPAAGAINVSIARQVEVSSPVSIASGTVTIADIEFNRTSEPIGAVPFRRILSGSGRTLAIVPLSRLAEGATYTVTVSGLKDVVGGDIVVPDTSFTTQSTTSPEYDLDALVFSFPDDDGLVTLNGPPDTLAPGSTILIVNESTGEVSTLGVNNDGSVSDVGGKFVAHISDRLIVTITDPIGRTTSFKRSEYVRADGMTAVGNGGGEILGPGGVEVRIPEDAVMQGVAAMLKIAAISLDQLPEGPLPDLPGATTATALKLEAEDSPPSFAKEVDLVFPKPADAPADAVYIIYRRMDGPDGRVAYEAIDFAEVEGDKVVTASDPWPGYVSSVNGFNASGLDFGGAISNQFTNYAILMWSFDLVNPSRTLGGAITGKVLRAAVNKVTGAPIFEAVAGALVKGVDESGEMTTVAASQTDGTYTLFDRRFIGGSVSVSATVDGVVRTATAYEVPRENVSGTGLRFSKAIATANITFPALPPTVPPSPVQVEVMTLDANGVRKASNGIVIAGEEVVIGIKAGPNTVQRVDVQSGSQSSEYGVQVDPLGKKANGFDSIVDGSLPLATPGSYTITATTLGPDGGVVIGHTVVRAIVAGGGNNDPLPNDRPSVITARTVPKLNAVGVTIGVLPQIAFTEPVQNVPFGVTLVEEGGVMIGVVVSGVGPNGPIASLTPQSIVTSITIQPSVGLKYGKKYTLSLSSDIFDTDPEPNPRKALVPYSVSFTTFTPESIGRTDDRFTAGGMAVMGDRAYIATPQNVGRWFTNLRLFDVGDPMSPVEMTGGSEPSGSQVLTPPPAFWLGLPVDVAADQESPLTGGPVVAVATTPLVYPYHSSSVRLFDVSNEQQWRWIGAVSLGRDPLDGMIRRIEMKGSMLYAVTAGIGKGIQFVDLNAVQGAFNDALADGDRSARYWDMQRQLNSTEGFAPEAIVQTLAVDTGLGANSQLWDLAVTDLAVNTVTQPAVIATGRSPLVVATLADGVLFNGQITNGLGGPALTGWGYGVAAGSVGGTPLAVVSAIGLPDQAGNARPHVLAVVDLSAPSNPRALKVIPLEGTAAAVQDVVLRDTMVFVGTNAGTHIVSLADPNNPVVIGTVPVISGRLGFTDSGLLLGSYRGLTQVTHAEGGLKTAALQDMTLITRVTLSGLSFNQTTTADVTDRGVQINFRMVPSDYMVDVSRVELLRNGNPILQLDATAVNGIGTATLPPNTPIDRHSAYTVRSIVNPATASELISFPVNVPIVDWTFVNKRGEEMMAPLVSDPRPLITLSPVSTADVVLSSNGQQATVKLKGEVTDAVADVTEGHTADITEVQVEGTAFKVERVAQSPTEWRPFAFKGKFEATVTVAVGDGVNTISAEATNAVGLRGFDSVTLNIKQTYPEPLGQPQVGAVLDTRFADPFTLVVQPLRGDVADSIALYHGVNDPTGQEATLVETTAVSRVFEGVIDGLGTVSVRITGDAEQNTLLRDRIVAHLTSSELVLDNAEFEFFETAPASAAYRSIARRLPSNRRFTAYIPTAPTPFGRDTVQLALGDPQSFIPFLETALDSRVFTGPLAGVATTLELVSMQNDPEQTPVMRVLLTSAETTSPLLLDMNAVDAALRTYQTDVREDEDTADAQLAPLSTELLSIDQNASADAGFFEPVFVIAKGLRTMPRDGAVANIDDRQFPITLARVPQESPMALMSFGAQSLPAAVRSRTPHFFVEPKQGRQLPESGHEVSVAGQAPKERDPRTYFVRLQSGTQEVRNERSGTLAKTAHLVRGSMTQLQFGFLEQQNRPTPEAIEISGDGVTVSTSVIEYSTNTRAGGTARQARMNVDVSVTQAAALGRRTLTMVMNDNSRVEYPNLINVSRGRMVMFAIDGLSADQFEREIRADAVGPKLGDGLQTALHTIFTAPMAVEGTEQAARATELTTFPPITFSRWATVFSGEPPNKTLVPGLNWFNRAAVMAGEGGEDIFGSTNQFLGLLGASASGPGTAALVLKATSSYNRHHQVPFVYDTLGATGLRSVVIVQQAGTGKDYKTNNSEWIQGTFAQSVLVGLGETITPEFGASTMDGSSVKLASDEIKRKHGDFDLMVVYLPGLDHYLHSRGAACSEGESCADRFFRLSLHGHINRLFTEMADLLPSTVFGVTSDHGHVAVNTKRFINLDEAGSEVQARSMLKVLSPYPGYRVGSSHVTVPLVSKPNVIFVPQFGMAQIYVAPNAGLRQAPDWSTLPQTNRLAELTRSLYKEYVEPHLTPGWDNRPVAAILVRAGDRYKAFAPDVTGCTEQGCAFEDQLIELSELTGIGPNLTDAANKKWLYADADRRVNQEFISVNTGDIILLANVRNGFQFGKPYASQHGTLTSADALVPVAFGYPGASGPKSDDDLFAPLRQFFKDLPSGPDPVRSIIEAPAIRRFFEQRQQ